jgi:hypothetical protein
VTAVQHILQPGREAQEAAAVLRSNKHTSLLLPRSDALKESTTEASWHGYTKDDLDLDFES